MLVHPLVESREGIPNLFREEYSEDAQSSEEEDILVFQIEEKSEECCYRDDPEQDRHILYDKPIYVTILPKRMEECQGFLDIEESIPKE